MPFSSSSELLTWLSQNLFLNPQQVGELQPFIAQEPDLHAFCKELLRRDWLTAYQVNQILKTGGESLVVGANRLHSRLGEGAMGQVYRAWNVRLGRVVAVKMLHPDHTLSAKAMDRFRREMQTAGSLDHPNIVLLRDADEMGRVPFLVMDYFDGIDLSRKTKQEGPQPIPQAVEWIRQAALGLQHAYERGVVHRDIKPSNLLLVRMADGSPVVKILDFGLAKFAREEDGQQPLTQAGRLIGTVDFIAPEQAQDARVADCRADVYSLGCTMFYLLTNKAPFPGNDQMEKLTARIEKEPSRLREHRPDAPAGLEEVLLRMMARRPEDRYQTPLEAAYALAPFSTSAAPPAPYSAAAPATPMVSPANATPMVALPVMAMEDLPEATPAEFPEATALAMPVNMPVRMPVDMPEAIAVGESPSYPPLGDSAFGEPSHADSTTPAAVREAEAPARTGGMLWVIIAAGLAVLLVSAGAVGYVVTRPTGPVVGPTLGTMTLEFDSPPDRVWAWKDRKPIIVKVTRHNFSGPVVLALDNPPKWARLQSTKSIPSQGDRGDVIILISWDEFEGADKLRITASSPNSHPATIEYPIEVVRPK